MGSHTSLTTRIKVEIQRGAAAKARLTHPECYLVRRGSTSDHHTIHAMRALHGSSHPKLAFSSVRAGAISAPAQPEVARAAANARHEPQSCDESRRLTRRTGHGGPGANQSPRLSSTPQHAVDSHHPGAVRAVLDGHLGLEAAWHGACRRYHWPISVLRSS